MSPSFATRSASAVAAHPGNASRALFTACSTCSRGGLGTAARRPTRRTGSGRRRSARRTIAPSANRHVPVGHFSSPSGSRCSRPIGGAARTRSDRSRAVPGRGCRRGTVDRSDCERTQSPANGPPRSCKLTRALEISARPLEVHGRIQHGEVLVVIPLHVCRDGRRHRDHARHS